MSLHVFDEATVLTALAEGRFQGHTHKAYWNMAGPFGGMTAAVMLKAVISHPQCRGRPVSQTVNFCAAVAEGAFEVVVTLVRDGRSTQHWQVEMVQDGAVVSTSSAVTGPERETWNHLIASPPQVPPADQIPVFDTSGRMGWMGAYQFRFHCGPPATGASREAPGSGLTQVWARDWPERALDYPALASLADTFVVKILQVRGDVPPVATVSLSTYFLGDEAALARQSSRPLLASSDVRAFQHGFSDQSSELWSDDGTLLAVSHQVVWFKS